MAPMPILDKQCNIIGQKKKMPDKTIRSNITYYKAIYKTIIDLFRVCEIDQTMKICS
jgi:hypothetical protein